MVARIEPSPKRVRCVFAGVVVADSRQMMLVWDGRPYPTYYFPAGDVRTDLLVPTGAVRAVPEVGDAELSTLTVGPRSAQDAVARFPDSAVEAVRDMVRIEWAAMDEWLEEDEPVYTHARDPHARVDILATSRRVVVTVGGEVVVETDQPRILFETGLPPRYYLPLAHVRADLMVPSPTVTHCPYKGDATYWTAVVGELTVPDVAWMYRAPLPESQRIAGLVSFYPDRAEVTVDGERL